MPVSQFAGLFGWLNAAWLHPDGGVIAVPWPPLVTAATSRLPAVTPDGNVPASEVTVPEATVAWLWTRLSAGLTGTDSSAQTLEVNDHVKVILVPVAPISPAAMPEPVGRISN